MYLDLFFFFFPGHHLSNLASSLPLTQGPGSLNPPHKSKRLNFLIHLPRAIHGRRIDPRDQPPRQLLESYQPISQYQACTGVLPALRAHDDERFGDRQFTLSLAVASHVPGPHLRIFDSGYRTACAFKNTFFVNSRLSIASHWRRIRRRGAKKYSGKNTHSR